MYVCTYHIYTYIYIYICISIYIYIYRYIEREILSPQRRARNRGPDEEELELWKRLGAVREVLLKWYDYSYNIYIYICMYYIYIYVYTQLCIYIYIYICMYKLCKHMFMYICIYTHGERERDMNSLRITIRVVVLITSSDNTTSSV